MSKLTVLFGMAHPGFLRNFETVIRELLIENVNVHIHFSKQHEIIKVSDYVLFEKQYNGTLSTSFSEPKPDVLIKTERIRLVRNIIHYANPIFANAKNLRERLYKLQKPIIGKQTQIKLLNFFDKTPQWFCKLAEWMLSKVEIISNPTKFHRNLIKKLKPNCVIVTPLVNLASKELDLLKSARLKKIPTLLATASWDNLTNKGRILIQPDRVAVWNNAMKNEAIKLHSINDKKIWITGAPIFDAWFDQKPSRDRATFCAKFGFDLTKPIIIYLCSSESIAGKNEHTIIKDWKTAIDQSKNETLRQANILIRPHPMALSGWEGVKRIDKEDFFDFYEMKVWLGNGKHPTRHQDQADFFDLIYHSDIVVGLNTSAMIEATILNKPVLTFLGHSATLSQIGNLHFSHLVEGGSIIKAENLNEHIQQLQEAIVSNKSYANTCENFVLNFVRPNGRDVNASKRLVKLILEDLIISKNKVYKTMSIDEANNTSSTSDYLTESLKTSAIRPLQLIHIFPGIENQSIEIGAIDPDTNHPNHVDMLYVCAMARHTKARNIFEFGTYLGRTTYHLALGSDAEAVYTLDLNPSTGHAKDLKLGRAIKAVHQLDLQGHFFRLVNNKITQLHGDSRTFNYADYHDKMDFIFIDGGHTYELIKNDTAHAFKMLKPGGIIVWHDFASKSPDVITFAKELSSSHPLFWIRNTSLLVYIDGVDAISYMPPILPYSRNILKPPVD